MKNRILKVVVNCIVMVITLSSVFPIVWMLMASMKTSTEFTQSIIALPSAPRVDNYVVAVRQAKMIPAFFSSAFLCAVSIPAIIGLSFCIGYALSRFRFRGRNALTLLFTAGLLIPIHSLMVPVFTEFKVIGLLDTRMTLFFPYVAYGLPIGVLLVQSFVGTIPIELEEAAFMDGSSLGNTLTRIIFPVSRPVIATVLILSFLAAWNEFPFALILVSRPRLLTLPLALRSFFGQYSVDYVRLIAALVVVTIPVILVYLLSFRQVIEGMTAGAVKG